MKNEKLLIGLSALGLIFLANFLLKPKNTPKAISGDLFISLNQSFTIRNWNIELDSAQQRFTIQSVYEQKIKSGESFIQAAIGKEKVNEFKGSFFIKDKLLETFANQTIEKAVQLDSFTIQIEGRLKNRSSSLAYTLILSLPKENTLNYRVVFDNKNINRSFLKFERSKNDQIYGTGEQFTHLNLNGYYVPIFISEQGIGRGKQILSFLVDLVAKSAGNEFTSYALTPWFMHSDKYSFYLENTSYSAFDFRDDTFWQIRSFANQLKGSFVASKDYAELLYQNGEKQGFMRPLPDWIHRGAIIGMQGGSAKVAQVYEKLKALNTPLSGFWLQDWVGQRTTSFGKQLWWNWQLDSTHYPNWPDIHPQMAFDSISLLAYVNPFMVDVSENKPFTINLYEIAKNKGYLILDSTGNPYIIPNTDFSAALLDLSNPEARNWFKSVIKQQLISKEVKGWMADFGEALPYDAVLFSGVSAKEYHNIYPVEWEKLNREIINEMPDSMEFVFFSRAGFSKSSAYTTLFWAGDQLVSWDNYDGMQSSVTALISSGLSGMTLNHSDIGGYTAIANPLLNYFRSEELLYRWIQLNAFSLIFRTHEGNRPTENAQFYDNEYILKHFDRYAKIFASLFEYRKMLIKEASEKAMPPIRAMFLEFPEDKICTNIASEQFMFGSDFLVAPIYEENAQSKSIYLPKAEWINLWTGREISSKGEFIEYKIQTNSDIPVFYLKNTAFGFELRSELLRKEIIK